MSQNTAATLSYVLGWLTGIIFFLIDKRPCVRFHAAQSMATFGGLNIIRVVLAMIFGFGFFFGRGQRPWGYGTMAGFGSGPVLLSPGDHHVRPVDCLHDQGSARDMLHGAHRGDVAENLVAQ